MLHSRLRLTLCSILLSLAACASPEERAGAASAEADQAFAAGDYYTARSAISTAIALREDVPAYWLTMGRVQLALNNFAGAYSAYQRALELDRSSLEALQNLAQLALLAGRVEEADDLADQIVLLVPDNLSAALVKGYIALRRKKYDEAEKRADSALEVNPGDEAALDLKARAVFGSGARRKAIELVESSVKVFGPTRTKLVALEEFYRMSGDAAGLESAYARRTLLEPEDWQTRLSYAKQLFLNGKADQAIDEIEAVLQAAPKRAKLGRQVAAALIRAEDGALNGTDLLRLAAPAAGHVQVAIASVALARAFPEQAAALMEPFVGDSVTNFNATATAIFAEAKFRMGDKRLALGLAERVLAFDPSNARALHLRSQMSLERHDYEQALRDAQVLVREQPRLASARTLLARSYMGRGQPALALLTYRRAHHDFPADESIFAEYLQVSRQERGSAVAGEIARAFLARRSGSPATRELAAAACKAAAQSCVS